MKKSKNNNKTENIAGGNHTNEELEDEEIPEMCCYKHWEFLPCELCEKEKISHPGAL
jgi:hypothetical protein